MRGMIDKLRPMHSNEIEALQECLRMIGGSKEYQQALIFAAYVRTFKDDLTVVITPTTNRKEYYINAYPVEGFHNTVFQIKIPAKYTWMFEEDADGKRD